MVESRILLLCCTIHACCLGSEGESDWRTEYFWALKQGLESGNWKTGEQQPSGSTHAETDMSPAVLCVLHRVPVRAAVFISPCINSYDCCMTFGIDTVVYTWLSVLGKDSEAGVIFPFLYGLILLNNIFKYQLIISWVNFIIMAKSHATMNLVWLQKRGKCPEERKKDLGVTQTLMRFKKNIQLKVSVCMCAHSSPAWNNHQEPYNQGVQAQPMRSRFPFGSLMNNKILGHQYLYSSWMQ